MEWNFEKQKKTKYSDGHMLSLWKIYSILIPSICIKEILNIADTEQEWKIWNKYYGTNLRT